MKKLLVISIIFIGLIFISGCISGEKATDSKTLINATQDQKSDAQTPDLIIKPSDVPGLTLNQFYFMSVPKSISYNYNYTLGGGRQYTDVLPLGYRYVGQSSQWTDKSGKVTSIFLIIYDSNSGFNEAFNNMDLSCKYLKANRTRNPEILDTDCGSPNIGDNSIYYYTVNKNVPDVKDTNLVFVKKNYYIGIFIRNEKDKSLNEAIRIANIVESRLN